MNDYLLEKVIMHPEIGKMSVSQQSDIARAFAEIFEQIGKENPYATIQSILQQSTDDL